MARVTGPLAAYALGFRDELLHIGYSERSARDGVYLLAHLSRWLIEQDLGPASLTAREQERFLAARRNAGYRRPRSVRPLRVLLGYLGQFEAIPSTDEPARTCALDALLDQYRTYLKVERRLAPSTMRTNVDVARRFLCEHAGGEDLDVERLAVSDVTEFMIGQSSRYSVGSMKVISTAIRSLLRFLHVTGAVERNLAGAVLPVAGRRAAPLPRVLDDRVITALLQSCDQTTVVGRRDFAILTLLARLGLRAGEIAGLRLDDVDWKAGELLVRGKGNRLDRLPLPHDVGEALADYLCHGRPPWQGRCLFLRTCAPSGAITPHAITMVPRSASRRAGIATVGAHQLRHRAATSMMRQGATLSDVAQVLRHRSESTTRIYVRVDRAALDLVVRPWPGVER
jgi:site-specific recombinase XerD